MKDPDLCYHQDCINRVDREERRWSSDKRVKPSSGGAAFNLDLDWDVCQDCGNRFCARHIVGWYAGKMDASRCKHCHDRLCESE